MDFGATPIYPINAFLNFLFSRTEPKFALLSKIYKKFTDNSYKIMMPGGANVTGVIGHIGALFELVDEIEKGNLIEPKHLFLAVGSTCTISGLVTGLCLCRKLGRNAFKNIDQFTLNGVITHHQNAMVLKTCLLSVAHLFLILDSTFNAKIC